MLHEFFEALTFNLGEAVNENLLVLPDPTGTA